MQTDNRTQEIFDRIMAGAPMTIAAAAVELRVPVPMLVAMMKAAFRGQGADVDGLTFHENTQAIDAIATLATSYPTPAPSRAERRRAERNMRR